MEALNLDMIGAGLIIIEPVSVLVRLVALQWKELHVSQKLPVKSKLQ